MTALPETQAQRWARLHRRIREAGRLPAMTLAGCELQAAMLDSGEMKPLPPPSPSVRRAMLNDARQRDELYAGRWADEDAEARELRGEYREAKREARELEDETREWPFSAPEPTHTEET